MEIWDFGKGEQVQQILHLDPRDQSLAFWAFWCTGVEVGLPFSQPQFSPSKNKENETGWLCKGLCDVASYDLPVHWRLATLVIEFYEVLSSSQTLSKCFRYNAINPCNKPVRWDTDFIDHETRAQGGCKCCWSWDSNSHHLAPVFTFLTTMLCYLSIRLPWKQRRPPTHCRQVRGHFYRNRTMGT